MTVLEIALIVLVVLLMGLLTLMQGLIIRRQSFHDEAAGQRLKAERQRDELKSELERERERAAQLDVDLVDLLMAARPLAEKTSWSFEGTHQARAREVARNNQAEELRKVIQRISGATLREENLHDATGGKTFNTGLLTQSPPKDIDAPIFEQTQERLRPRPLGGVGGYVGEIVDPDYNWDAKREKIAEDTEAFLRSQPSEDGQ